MNSDPDHGKVPASDSDRLYMDWLNLVEANLGRDPDRAARSARAAVEAIRSGLGYNAAVHAAHSAWADPDAAFDAAPTATGKDDSAAVALGGTPKFMRARWFAFLGAALALLFVLFVAPTSDLGPWSLLLWGLLVTGGAPLVAIAAGFDKPSRGRAGLLGYAAVGVLVAFLEQIRFIVDFGSVVDALLPALGACALITAIVLSTREGPRGASGIIVSALVGAAVGIGVMGLILFATSPVGVFI